MSAIGIAHAWHLNRRRMANFRAWTSGRGFCVAGLRVLALARSPEEALREAALVPNENRDYDDDYIEAGETMAHQLDPAGFGVSGSIQCGPCSTAADAIQDAEVVIASTEWRAMLDGTWVDPRQT